MTQLLSPPLRGNARLQQAANNPKTPIAWPETSPAVAKLQSALIQLGYTLPSSTRKRGEPDGIFGPETKAALKRFQEDYKLTNDGMAGPDSLGEMDSLLLYRPAPRHREVHPILRPTAQRLISKVTQQEIQNTRTIEEPGSRDHGDNLGKVLAGMADDIARTRAHPLEQGDPDPNDVVAREMGNITSSYVLTQVAIFRVIVDLGTQFSVGYYITRLQITRSYRYVYGPGNAQTRVRVTRETSGFAPREMATRTQFETVQPSNYVDP